MSPKVATLSAHLFWRQLREIVPEIWWVEADQIIADAEKRRSLAKFNTGSISRVAAVALRSICAWCQPRTIAEVGTFIGVSTFSLDKCGAFIVTCDASNDCVQSQERIGCYPYTKSHDMLTALVAARLKIDLFFFDGLLSELDVPQIHALSLPETVYVMDDFNGAYKGVHNVELLHPILPRHVLLPAADWVGGATTLAVLAPERLL